MINRGSAEQLLEGRFMTSGLSLFDINNRSLFMKHIIWPVIAAAMIFTTTESFARGFSVGVFGAYSIDGGNIEKIIDDARTIDSGAIMMDTSYETLRIPGSGIYGVYEFSNNSFIRIGFEYYKLVSGGDISHMNRKYSIEYEALAWPLLFGFNVSPDKGRTNLYASAGVIIAKPNNKFYKKFDNAGIIFEYTSDKSSIVPGFAGLLGIERKLIQKTYLTFEYAFYKCEDEREETSEYYTQGSYYEYKYTERYGLPRQQARIGLKYQF